ncbi:MAG: dihydroorotate dehydrogenase electron transfer subunit [Proteobacteria bacterium]|nr:dihydroorotate dehydrogenase electron transfer subunit [Pseudomonadota bacterium]MBU1714164.1 dihydroorotate dehydrogenase electron transfer subunit [Pseudomonadota bacterium]
MKPVQLKAEVMRNEKLSSDITRLTMMARDIADIAKPGQFVMIRPTSCYDPLLRRPFSLHQVTGDGLIEILFKVVGRGTRILSAVEVGEFLDVVGPLGKGFLDSSRENICLLGGGMGIAPLLFLAKWLVSKKTGDLNFNIVVLLGAATDSEILPLLDDFEVMGLNVKIATDDGSLGYHGFVTDLLSKNLDPDNNWIIYSCGPYPMLKKVAGISRDNNWQCQVSLETIMACGIKACLGCALPKSESMKLTDTQPYAHVCKDGPVFDAAEVKWI